MPRQTQNFLLVVTIITGKNERDQQGRAEEKAGKAVSSHLTVIPCVVIVQIYVRNINRLRLSSHRHLSLSLSRLKKAASKAIAEGDPWAKHEIDKVPAERVIRHMYQPETQTWKQDETIVKMEKESFTNGAMRFCYRMKKRSPPPQSASNHRFHDYGWTRASNYVAKAYLDENREIDTSDQSKQNVRNDILLQYEASHWSSRFNDHEPPKKIIFIRAYAIEFPDREGKPWFAVERYIFGAGK